MLHALTVKKKKQNRSEIIMLARIAYALNLHFNSLSVSQSRLTLPSYDIKQYRYLYMVLMATQILRAVFLPINSCTSFILQKRCEDQISLSIDCYLNPLYMLEKLPSLPVTFPPGNL